MLTQDPHWEKLFQDNGIRTLFVPNGVATNRFRPVGPEEKLRIRDEFQLPQTQRIMLHVGHLRPNRNLESLVELQQKSGWQVVVIASTVLKQSVPVIEKLLGSSIILIHGYLRDIEKIYACADAYIFPTRFWDGEKYPLTYNQVGVIDMPLSVLEAMSSNLPVITTVAPALRRLFSVDDAFRWFDGTAEDCLWQLPLIENATVQNRQKVSGLDWSIVIKKLETVYGDCVSTLL
jgi:glycosyltransferase involved in cell wall biosynthesis